MSIPYVIHQIWIGDEDVFPDKYKIAMASWRKHNPDFTFIYWTNSLCEEFLLKYDPLAYKVYKTLGKPIQKADFIRFFILYYIGGLYTDLDIICNKSVKSIYDYLYDYDVIIYSTPVLVDLDFIVSKPRSKLIEELVVLFKTIPFEEKNDSYLIAERTLPVLNRLHDSNIIILKENYLFNCSNCNTNNCQGEKYFTRFDDMSYGTFFDKFGKGLLCTLYNLLGRTGVRISKKMHGIETDYYYN